MAASRFNLVFEQGSKFTFGVVAKSSDGTIMDLTGYSGKLQVRPTVSSTEVLLEASTANGRISIDGPLGKVTVTVGGDVTGALTWTAGIYDLEVSNSASNVIRLTEGFAYLSPEVTR